MTIPKPVVLIILDGWGYSENERGNAIRAADTRNLDHYWTHYPHGLLDASGEDVGLPAGQMGNSEVGHLNIGAGRIVYQDLVRISKAIHDGSFYDNPALLSAVNHVKERDGSSGTGSSALHLMGLIGPGGVHSHSEHLYALLQLAKQQGLQDVYVHCFLDGRDTLPTSGLEFVLELEQKMREIGVGRVATVSGRYYAMDRDNRWERVAKAYAALVHGQGNQAPSAEEAIRRSYETGVTDEFVVPTVIRADGFAPATLQSGAAAVFFNFRADRGRELTKAFVLPDFDRFDRGERLRDLFFVTLTEYEADLPVNAVAFAPENVRWPLARVLSERGLKQFHTAETEKYAHVTFFLNGGREEPFPGEDRLLIPSPKVPTYDLQPEMSAYAVAENAVARIHSAEYDFIVINFANGDMVGHTGVEAAAQQAATAVDRCVGQVVEAVLTVGGVALVTADHGNAEQMIDFETGEPFTQHTTNPVPVYLIGAGRGQALRARGRLADLAPTILALLNIPQEEEMTGESLIISTQQDAIR